MYLKEQNPYTYGARVNEEKINKYSVFFLLLRLARRRFTLVKFLDIYRIVKWYKNN